ncbi:DNA mismatch repair protein MutL [Dethiosulfatibacter aminovorans DSM 17477]|uniref:DNA mismatch repair protein MutL n=1 Tax=Dethiosulfatibacter aminovorans DSM 17477 TaxID=1121476 RepID=A0A1M6DBJ0_9FIRM|nr:DNA mismatch repair endonuclease MutL [Dethiosulfatibacter aminovorans]SHI70627.1 DNA mismatch repair protein MutL [Dethiosulfatibacter aminovorans DSM 17477]
MSKIKLLDEKTIDKIAAGEVVERPFSVVKELVENSIDSLADEIVVEIKNGGKSYIRITDNGSGISNDDIGISVLRHATSKIRTVSDLYSLDTLGFRGEALSSISAVSKFELTSKTEGEEMGKTVKISGGTTISEQFTGAPNGTTVIVRDLFYNIPARKKFLKTDKSEGSAITDLITRLSLINTDISFKLIRDGKIIHTTPKNTTELNVISSILGSDFSRSLMEIEYSSDMVDVRGYITNLNYYRANRKMQLIYVNDRFIIDKDISSSIEKAYSTMLPKGKFPGFILYINLDPSEIDVNIHPQKSKIKFNDMKFLEDLLYSLISKKLRSRFLTKSAQKKTSLNQSGTSNISSNRVSEQIKVFTPEEISDGFILNPADFADNMLVDTSDSQNLKSCNKKTVETSEISTVISGENEEICSNENSVVRQEEISDDVSYIEGHCLLNDNLNYGNNQVDLRIHEDGCRDEFKVQIEEDIENSDNIIILENNEDNPYNMVYKELSYIGALFDSYLIFEDRINGNMFLMDQHAAHERINYERFINQFNSSDIRVQNLLVPELIHLDIKEYDKVLDNLETYAELGFEVENFGSKTIRISALPFIFTGGDIKRIFYDILDNMDLKKTEGNMGDYLNKLIKKACVASIKAGDRLDKTEVDNLLNELSKCRSPFTCPHGRPIWIRYSRHEIEKSFNRIN